MLERLPIMHHSTSTSAASTDEEDPAHGVVVRRLDGFALTFVSDDTPSNKSTAADWLAQAKQFEEMVIEHSTFPAVIEVRKVKRSIP